MKQAIIDFLKNHHIPFALHQHAPAHTLEECKQLPFVDEELMFCKNLMLTNRQQTTFYLLIMPPDDAFRTSAMSQSLGVSRLSFAKESLLMDLLHLAPGSVTPLALFQETKQPITFCYSAKVKTTAHIAFHPCQNDATLVFDQTVFWEKVVPLLGITPVEVKTSE